MTADPAILVMAKAPRPGQVKTRLAPMLGSDACARLHEMLVERTVALAVSVVAAATLLAFDPPDARDELAALVPPAVKLVPQRGRHLGERLRAGVADVFAAHAGPVLVVGTDIPMLGARHLCHALGRLDAGDEDDVVLGPARDGGYYLAGMNRLQASLFDIAPALWGGPRVLSASVAAARAAGLRVGLLEVLADLDTPADAVALAAEPALPAQVRALLRGPLAVLPGAFSRG
ncbi:MAG: TIGR04282 family arsenosugar biosynthesis glycosyltransferase [Acidimicrobiales bacterium]